MVTLFRILKKRRSRESANGNGRSLTWEERDVKEIAKKACNKNECHMTPGQTCGIIIDNHVVKIMQLFRESRYVY
jgi:hypothetical protein